MRFTRRRFLIGSGLGLAVALIGREIVSPSISQELPIAEPQLASPPEDVLFRYVAIGDSGAGDGNQRAVGAAMADYRAQNPYDLVTMCGDNIYDDGEIELIGEAFEEPYAKLLAQDVTFRACLGNHDVRTAQGVPQVKYDKFNMDDRYYTYRIGQEIQFFVLETNPEVNWQNQLMWLRQELEQSAAKYKIVYGHHPIYSSGHYGTDAGMIKRFSGIFQKYGVQLYMNGHEHHYERTAVIAGTTYLVTGHGGAYLRRVGKSDFTEFAVSRHGFSTIEIRQNSLTIQGIDRKGQIFDRGVVAI
jgi:hypothetical protein